MTVPFDLGAEVRRAVENATRELRVVNVLIAGRTGVGKSTLINAMFAGNLAETGQGRPVTMSTREYWKEGIPIRIFDTRGLEAAAYSETLEELRKHIASRANDPNPDRHIHIAWVCIAEDSRRVEDAEVQMHEMLARHVPVVGVVTKSRSDQGFKAVVQELLPLARNVARVRAIREELDDGHALEPMGLASLVELTLTLVPESHRRAFVAAQKASIEAKRDHARSIVATAAVTAAGLAAVPLPVADAVMIVPVQIGMIAGISSTFGLDLSVGTISTIVTSFVGAGAATVAGRWIVASLLKLFPGIGSVLGGLISAATAGTLTTTLGETYVRVLCTLFEVSGGETPTAEQVATGFHEALTSAGLAPGSVTTGSDT